MKGISVMGSICRSMWTITVIIMITNIISVTAAEDSPALRVDGKNISIEFDNLLHSRVIARIGEKEQILGSYTVSEFISTENEEKTDFALTGSSSQKIHDDIGSGEQHTIRGISGSLEKELIITSYDEFPLYFYFMSIIQTKVIQIWT